MRKSGLALLALIAALLVAGSGLLIAFQRDMQTARHRLAAGAASIETDCGAMEYAERGSGYPVLVIHGAGGGFDQGLFLGEFLIGEGYRIIAPSRFGYLNPVPEKHSLDDQAAAFACLLDALDIRKAVIVGFSAGGLPGLTFAHNYPEKTSALILGSAMSFTEGLTAEELNRGARINRIIGNDFVYWMLSKFAWKQMSALFGVPADMRKSLSTDDLTTMREVLQMMWPMSRRIAGVANDQTQTLARDYPLTEITAPTMVVHAENDTLVLADHARHSADGIPNAELMMVSAGGHFLVGQHDSLRADIRGWLADHGFDAAATPSFTKTAN